MSDREQRVAANEALFREVNERVADIVSELSEIAGSVDIFCECGDVDCVAKVTVDRPTYEAVRANPTRFLLLPGHEKPDVETPVDARQEFLIVEKLGEAAAVARSRDPRS